MSCILYYISYLRIPSEHPMFPSPGTMAFLTSLMWAMYKLKPGVPACFSPGAGAAGPGAGMSISSPRPASNLGAVQAASASGGGGAGAGSAVSKVTVVNGSAAG